ncbi:MAG: ethanolamine utilization protein EutH [Firmicutes bacterium]|nr:ethanolamine utilization protein EutH [Bacillota bacterium]
MEIIGKLVLYIIMICCAIGAVAAAIKPESGLAKSFHEGIGMITALFIPIVGLMISVPYLIIGTEKLFGGFLGLIGADVAVTASCFIPPDCGGYALAMQIASSPELVMMSICVGVMTASTIAFNIPVGISVLDKKDHPYLALGAMSGFLSIPFGVLTTCFILWLTKPMVRTEFVTTGPSTYPLEMDMGVVLINLIPIILLCVLLALGLKLIPKIMVKGFMVFGRTLMAVLTLVVAAAIIEYYTGIFSATIGWGFEPMLGDAEEPFRAIELLGTIGFMLAGAFPMVYLIRKYCSKPLSAVGRKLGLDECGSAGLVAGMANALAIFALVKDMNPKSKVMAIAFVVCAGYSIGDFIAFNMNFQPNMVLPLCIGQLVGGVIGIFFAKIIAVPSLKKIENTED